MGKFKEGDKVISVRDTHDVPEGFIGFVVETGQDVFEYTVVSKEGKSECFHEDELELLSVSNKQSEPRLADYLVEAFSPDKEMVEASEELKKLVEEYSGGSSSYYKVDVTNPTTSESPYQAECNDIIEALGLTFTEGNIFKAIWRIAADRNGKKKKGNNSIYDAEKVVFFAERLLIQEKSRDK